MNTKMDTLASEIEAIAASIDQKTRSLEQTLAPVHETVQHLFDNLIVDVESLRGLANELRELSKDA